MALADVVHEAQEPCGRVYATGTDCLLMSGGVGGVVKFADGVMIIGFHEIESLLGLLCL